MVTGKQTFRKPTSAETMTAILNDEPPSISQIAPTAPPGLQRVVHRCLEKNPEQRFQSAHRSGFRAGGALRLQRRYSPQLRNQVSLRAKDGLGLLSPAVRSPRLRLPYTSGRTTARPR